MRTGGFVKVYRSLLDHKIMQDDFLCRLWLWCLLKANWQDTGHNGTTVRRGSFRTGRIRASEELNVAPSKWYRGICRLQELGCIEVEANSNWTTITVCKFDTYQFQGRESEQRMDSVWTANEQPTLIDEEDEEGEEGGRTPKKAAAPRFTPPTIDDVRAYCQERGNNVDPQKWFDHYSANGWKVGRNPMKDWKAAVRTWERNGFDTANSRKAVGVQGKAGVADGISSIANWRPNPEGDCHDHG